MRVHQKFIRGAVARPWLAGPIAAVVIAIAFAGCDPSALGIGSTTQCTPQTCDYVVNTLVAVGSGTTDILLADAQASDGNNYVYQYSGSTWTKGGAENATHRGDGLIASPNFATDKTLFLGNSTSADGGATWTALCVIVKGISPDFANDHTVFGIDAAPAAASTGTPTGTPTSAAGCPSGTGAYYASTDSGKTWTAVAGPQGAGDPDVFTISPTYKSDKTIFATFTINLVTALYKSTDSGQTWNNVLAARQAVVAVSTNFAQDHTLIAVSDGKVQRSTDGGSTWSTLDTPVPSNQIATVAFSPNVAQDKTVVLASVPVDAGSTAPHGTYVSTDGGTTWNASGTVTQRGLNHPAFFFSPNFATNKTAYTSSQDQGKGPASSTDLGKTWTTFNTGLDLQAGLGG